MKKIPLILLTICCALITACDDDYKREPSDVAIFITPKANTPVVLSSGDKTSYHLDLYTTSDYIQRLRITSFDQLQGELTLKDTTWNQRVDFFDFVYTAPNIDRDSLVVKLTFTAWDNAGREGVNYREVTILNKQILVNEKSGITLWAAESDKPNALLFASPSNTFNQYSATDSTAQADLIMEVDADFEHVRLISQTGAKFVRNNSFDYAAATAISIQSVYESSRHDNSIEDLRINDIILVGHGTQSEGVFHVTNIIRTGLAEERCVQLAFKGVVPQ